MFERIKELLAKQLRKDPSVITMDAKIMADLGADSLDVLQLLMTVEDEFGVHVPDEELASFQTVGDVVTYLQNLEKA